MEVSLFLGVLVGLVMGVTGAGGEVLAVPALVVGMGWSMQQAAPVALLAVAGGAGLGAIEGWRKGLVRYRAAMMMVLFGLPFTNVGVVVAQWLPQRWLQGIFAAVAMIVAIRTLWQARAHRGGCQERKWARINPETGRFRWSWSTGALFAGIGALSGFLAGLLGVGGGFVVVPAIRRFTDISMHAAVATSLMVVALLASGGIVATLFHGGQLPWPTTLLFVVATALGMAVGRKAQRRLSDVAVQRGFALVLMSVAIGLFIAAVSAR